VSKNLLLLVGLVLSGCMNSPDIEDKTLNDRVKACSAGFSEQVQCGLNASMDKAQLKGGIDSSIKEETKSIIFSEIPEKDRLRAYEDYIGCIQKNWNKD
jgi:hypothetical protein